MIQRLAKVLTFDEASRKTLVYSDAAKLRLSNDNKADYGLELKKVNGLYPTDADLSIRSRIMKTMKLKRLLGFDEYATLPDDTALKYRILFGPTASVGRWWNGAAWVAAGASDWNTAAELAANLPSLTLPAPEVAVLVNLSTADPEATPHLREIRLLGEFDIEWWDDLIYDTIVRSLIDTLRATTDAEFAVAATTSTLDFATQYPLENKGYNFTGVKAVYNLTADPQMLQNLAGLYTPGAANLDGSFAPGSVALTSPVNMNDIGRVVFEHVPEIAVNTSQDYYEPERMPCVVFEKIEDIPTADGSGQRDNTLPGIVVRNVAALTAVDVGAPRQFIARFNYAVMSTSQMDQARVTDALNRWASRTRVIRTWGLDEQVNLEQESSLGTDGKTDLNDVKVTTGSFLIRGVTFFLKEAKDYAIVNQVNLDLELQ
jgi:hypothetical protein